MDLSEAVKYVGELAEKAAGAANKVAVVDLPNEPKGIYGLVLPDGTFRTCIASPVPRLHQLVSVDQVVPFVEDVASRLEAECSVWYSQAGIAVLLKDDKLTQDLASRATVALKHSPEFLTLVKEATGESQWRDPKAFVTFVRTKLIDAIPDGEELVKLLRSLKGSVTEGGHLRTSQGRESLGRDVDAEVTSDVGLIPDLIVCEVRVFSDPSIQRRSPIRCVLEVNPRTFELRLMPVQSDLQRAIDDELSAIGELFKQTLPCPVYYGVP